MWFSRWYNLANIQPPVSNVTFDDHTSCGQSVSNLLMIVMLKFLIEFYQPTEWKMEISWLFSIFHIHLQNSRMIGKWKFGGSFLFSISQVHHWPYGMVKPLRGLKDWLQWFYSLFWLDSGLVFDMKLNKKLQFVYFKCQLHPSTCSLTTPKPHPLHLHSRGACLPNRACAPQGGGFSKDLNSLYVM